MKLGEINSLIQLEEANSTQLPMTVEEKKKEMTTKYSELMTIHSQKVKAISRSADERQPTDCRSRCPLFGRFECSLRGTKLVIPNSSVTCDVSIIDIWSTKTLCRASIHLPTIRLCWF
jgi:hypothetical protein